MQTRQAAVRTELPKANRNDVSDLHKACRHGNLHDISFLLELDPSLLSAPSSISEDGLGCGAVALHYATIGNQPEVISFLLQKGAKVDLTTDRGLTPLHVACTRGFVDCANLLLQGGANALTQDRHGKSSHAVLKQLSGDPDMQKRRTAIARLLQNHSGAQSICENPILRLTDKILYSRR